MSGWDKSQPPSPIEVICICFALFGDAAYDSSIGTRASGIIRSNLLALWFRILRLFFLFPFLVPFFSLRSRQGIHAFCIALLSFSNYCGTKCLSTGSVLQAVQHLHVPGTVDWHSDTRDTLQVHPHCTSTFACSQRSFYA